VISHSDPSSIWLAALCNNGQRPCHPSSCLYSGWLQCFYSLQGVQFDPAEHVALY